jgi:hypothetical protein
MIPLTSEIMVPPSENTIFWRGSDPEKKGSDGRDLRCGDEIFPDLFSRAGPGNFSGKISEKFLQKSGKLFAGNVRVNNFMQGLVDPDPVFNQGRYRDENILSKVRLEFFKQGVPEKKRSGSVTSQVFQAACMPQAVSHPSSRT